MSLNLYALAQDVGQACLMRGWTLVAAESCTGGLLLSTLTDVSGSSRYVMGGMVAYHNALKRDWLGVSDAILAQEGAVSAACARQMAQGIRARIPADVGMSVTGIAGPDGGTPEKPVGLVYLGLAWGEHVEVTRHVWQGDREANKRASVHAMLTRLLALLRE